MKFLGAVKLIVQPNNDFDNILTIVSLIICQKMLSAEYKLYIPEQFNDKIVISFLWETWFNSDFSEP